ncbi:MAG: hypothetical protein LBC80_02055 [Treponema sp.]|nr:hypothetical protein [Treponema sp.]
MKKQFIFTIILIPLWLTVFAGCLYPDSDEVDVPELQFRIRIEQENRWEIVKVLNIDPEQEIRIAVHNPNTGARVAASAISTTTSLSVRQSGMDFFITGEVASGMGIVRFSSSGRTGELRIFVRNWKEQDVYRNVVYADMEAYPFCPNTNHDPDNPKIANKWAAYRLIVDAGFHYEAPDGLSSRAGVLHGDNVRATERRGPHDVPHIIMTNDEDYLPAAVNALNSASVPSYVRYPRPFLLNKEVFKFILHFEHDGDMVGGFDDRQRLELKTMDFDDTGNEHAHIPYDEKNIHRFSRGGGESFTHRWKFRLPDDFRVSSEYSHIFQIKAEGGDSGNPIFTLTGRRLRSGREVLQLIYRGPIRDNEEPSVNWYPAEVDLHPFKGEWIQAEQTATYDNPGTFTIRLVRIRDMRVLMEYTYSPAQYEEYDPFVMFRRGNSYIRPKFGIYRRIYHMTPFGLPDFDNPVITYHGEKNEMIVLFADIEMDKLRR